MLKEQLNMRISEHTRKQLERLAAQMKTTKTDVISLAIDRLYRQKERGGAFNDSNGKGN